MLILNLIFLIIFEMGNHLKTPKIVPGKQLNKISFGWTRHRRYIFINVPQKIYICLIINSRCYLFCIIIVAIFKVRSLHIIRYLKY